MVRMAKASSLPPHIHPPIAQVPRPTREMRKLVPASSTVSITFVAERLLFIEIFLCPDGLSAARGADPPHGVADIVGDEQCAFGIEGEADGAALGFSLIGGEEAGHDILWHTCRSSGLERYIDHFVAIERAAIPAAMFGDEDAAAISCRQS